MLNFLIKSNSFCDVDIDLTKNLTFSEDGNVKKIDLMTFLKIIFEGIDKYNINQYKKALIDQHSGFISTNNLINILISAFKYYFIKKNGK
jgi:hypothetical protein